MRRLNSWLRLCILLPLICGALGVLGILAAPAAHADAPHIDLVTFQRNVDPASARFLSDVIDTAQSDGATLLVIELDTPGGDLDSMKQIVQKERASTVHIAVYVTPSGGRAGSAAH